MRTKIYTKLKHLCLFVFFAIWGIVSTHAQTFSIDDWQFNKKSDGTVQVMAPVNEYWYNGGYQYLIERIESSLVIPSTLTEKIIEWDGIRYSIVSSGNTYVVTGIGNGLTDAQRLAVTSISIPNTVTSIASSALKNLKFLPEITIPSSVTSIDNYAFQNDSALVSISVPVSVTSMGVNVFENCAALQSATVMNSNIGYAQFAGCSALKDVTISNNVTSIGSNAFANCSSVETLTIPTSVTSFGFAFGGMTGLKNLNFYAPIVGSSLFSGFPIENLDLTGVGTIKESAFSRCSQLKTVTLSESLGKIENYVFRYDSALVSITIPASVTSMGVNNFENCIALKSATVLNNDIEYAQFSGCSTLKDVTISNNVTSIGSNAFANCSSVETLTIPASVTSFGFAFGGMTGLKNLNFYAPIVGSSLFSGLPIENLDLTGVGTIKESAFSRCSQLKTVTLSESLGKIENYVFRYDSALVSITIPASVTSMGVNNFENCIALKSATVLNNDIEYAQFSGCSALKDVTISNNVTSIGSNAFANCTALQKVTVAWQTPLSVSSNIFSGVNLSAATLYVPVGTKTLYQAAPVWKDFGTIIEVEAPTYSLSVDPTSLNFAASGGEQTFTITSNVNWSIPSTISWLTISPTSGSGDATVTVTAAPNTTGVARNASIPVVGTGVDPATVSVTQDTAPSMIPVTNITGVPETAPIGVIDLSGSTVVPSDATYTKIVWSIKDAGTTGASVTTNVIFQYVDGVLTPVTQTNFVTTAAGTLIMTATVVKGNADGTNYKQDFPITITAVPNPDLDAVNAAKAIIEDGTYTVQQATANTEETVKAWLVDQINALDGMSDTGITVTADAITFDSFTPAVSNVKGNYMNGSFAFTVSLAKGDSQADASAAGTIIFTFSITITGVPETVTVGTPFTLPSMVQGGILVNWNIKDAGTTGTFIDSREITYQYVDGILTPIVNITYNTTSEGSLVVTANVYGRNNNALIYSQDFTINVVAAPTYHVNIGTFTGGSITSDKDVYEEGETVALNILPDDGYELASVSAYKTGKTTTEISLDGSDNTRTFTMPAFDVTVTATFKETPSVTIPDDTIKVNDNGTGSIEINLTIPGNTTVTGSFEIHFPDGMSLDEQLTVLSLQLSGNFSLTFTYKGNNTWLIEIKSTALRSSTVSELQKIMDIAFTVDAGVSNGTYEAEITNLAFLLNDGTAIRIDSLTVPITVNRVLTSIEAVRKASFSANIVNNRLRVESANEELITVYSISGVRLYSVMKNPGSIDIPFTSMRGSAFIIRGSVSGTIKIIKN